ncbi:hypothetical protein [Endozoicomonas sp. 4G]|uniref:hypothetical protein n=1 Tax=Endozoicomonas sp. 4G TaxID=2872754 RepID=UPI0020790C68|nr:hypothetical protein [Endozoicomonas sp. 4G]
MDTVDIYKHLSRELTTQEQKKINELELKQTQAESELLKDEKYISILDRLEEFESRFDMGGSEYSKLYEQARQIQKSYFKDYLDEVIKNFPEVILAIRNEFRYRQEEAVNADPVQPFDDLFSYDESVTNEDIKSFKQALIRKFSLDQNIPLPLKAGFTSHVLGMDQVAAQHIVSYCAEKSEKEMSDDVERAIYSLSAKQAGSIGGKARHVASNKAREQARFIAKECWSDNESNPPRIGVVSKWINDELKKKGFKPPADKVIRQWISDIAPAEAKKGGRPKNKN